MESIANAHVLLALKKRPFRWYKGADSRMTKTVERLRDSAQASAWQTAVLQQTPANVWAHHNELTEYQVWVIYWGQCDNSISNLQGMNPTVAVGSCSAAETPRKHRTTYLGHARAHRLVERNLFSLNRGILGA